MRRECVGAMLGRVKPNRVITLELEAHSEPIAGRLYPGGHERGAHRFEGYMQLIVALEAARTTSSELPQPEEVDEVAR
jgi:hypothetical protein